MKLTFTEGDGCSNHHVVCVKLLLEDANDILNIFTARYSLPNGGQINLQKFLL